MKGLFPGKKVIGLTGGIGSGKSLVAAILKSKGYAVIDADQISRELTNPGGEAYDAFVKLMGTDDRKKIREIITHDAQKKSALEKLLHPLIQKKADETIQSLPPSTLPILFYEAALLVETRANERLDGLWVVEAPKNLRIERIIKRDSVSKEAAESLIQVQSTDDARRKVATQILVNKDSPKNLEEQVNQALSKLGALSS